MSTPRPAPTARVQRFESLAYGLFLHYGLYSLSEQGEWYFNYHKPDPAEYAARQRRFTASGFDAPALARWAKAAGFRYACMGARHHEGFSLFDTRGLNTYDSLHAPCGRDLVREFVDACRAEGLGVFLYHTTLDWWHPDFDGDWKAYQRYLRASVELLCTRYGRIDGFWFDGNWSRKDRDWEEDALYGMIRGHQPEAILVNNSSHGGHGVLGHPELDVVTFEQAGPSAAARAKLPKPVAMERCETMNSHWGIAAHDYSLKSPSTIIDLVAACRSQGANLLLNVGPAPDGSIPPYDRAALDVVGRWISTCAGRALYDGRPVPELVLRNGGFALRAPGSRSVFAFVPNVPIHGNRHLLRGEPGDGWQTVAGPLGKVARVAWTDTGESLPFTQRDDGAFLAFDASPNPYGRQVHLRVAEIELA